MNERYPSGRLSAFELFVLSLASLYFELLIIRWLSGDIRFFSVFKTFPLIACFIGLGFGYASSSERLFRFFPVSVLLLSALIWFAAITGIEHWHFPSASIELWQDLRLTQLSNVMLCVPIVLSFFTAAFLVMASFGARIGILLNTLKPLTGYSLNITGAVTGSALFVVCSFLGWHPSALLLIGSAIVLPFLWKATSYRWISVVILAFGILLSGVSTKGPLTTTYWSPYQQISTVPLRYFSFSHFDDVPRYTGIPDWNENRSPISQSLNDFWNKSFAVCTNHLYHQLAIDLSPLSGQAKRLSPRTSQTFELSSHYYESPYSFVKPKEILVVGAGTGNDVAMALRQGVCHIDAVEIDPTIIEIGRKMHPEKPYSSSAVSVICDDARNYFRHCSKHYDMIIFGALDSQTVTGQGSSARIDGYVYTRESFAQVIKLLKPNGVLVIIFCIRSDWMMNRFCSTIHAAVGIYPQVYRIAGHPDGIIPIRIFVVSRTSNILSRNTSLGPLVFEPRLSKNADRIITDDWPYLYVSPILFDWPYWLVMASVLALVFLSVRNQLVDLGQQRFWQMFFLGAAFILLELKSIAQLSLIYGATWLTSAVAISGILLMILVANLLVIRYSRRAFLREQLLYLFLGSTLTVNYLVPNDSLLALDAAIPCIGRVLATIVPILPLFAAAAIFSVAFSTVKVPGRALAFNLLGSVVGGLLEYASIYIGIRNLALVAALLYLISYMLRPRQARFQQANDVQETMPEIVSISA